jgi:hypothetical protein
LATHPLAAAVASIPLRTAEELHHLQEDAVAAFSLWQEGKAQEEVEPDQPGPGRKGRQRADQ